MYDEIQNLKFEFMKDFVPDKPDRARQKEIAQKLLTDTKRKM